MLVVVPRDDIAGGQHHLGLDRGDEVRAFVVGVVGIHRQDRAVPIERMAIGADRQMLQNNRRRLRRGNRPEAPPDARRVLVRLRERQNHLPIEQRRPHRVLRRSKGHPGPRQDSWRPAPTDAENDDLGLVFERSAFEDLPVLQPGRPPRPPHQEVHIRLAIGKCDPDQPPAGPACPIPPAKRRRHHLRRKQRPIKRILERDVGVGRALLIRGEYVLDAACLRRPSLVQKRRGDQCGGHQSHTHGFLAHRNLWFNRLSAPRPPETSRQIPQVQRPNGYETVRPCPSCDSILIHVAGKLQENHGPSREPDDPNRRRNTGTFPEPGVSKPCAMVLWDDGAGGRGRRITPTPPQPERNVPTSTYFVEESGPTAASSQCRPPALPIRATVVSRPEMWESERRGRLIRAGFDCGGRIHGTEN